MSIWYKIQRNIWPNGINILVLRVVICLLMSVHRRKDFLFRFQNFLDFKVEDAVKEDGLLITILVGGIFMFIGVASYFFYEKGDNLGYIFTGTN
eukprot:UN00703